MKKIHLAYCVGIIFFISIVSFAFIEHNEESDKKKYCIWIRQDGKNWYECSPEAVSPSNAVDLVKKKYPKAKVTRSSDSNCKCN